MFRSLAAFACLASCAALVVGESSGGMAEASAADDVGPVPGLDPAALEVMNRPAYANAQWFISVRDLDTGEQLVSLNSDKLAGPASVTKTYSMGAAWQRFGPDHRVVTPVKRQGRIVRGQLRGDLILVGKGDLTMGGRTRANGKVAFTNLDHNDANGLPGATLTKQNPLAGLHRLAREVRASGVRRVSGDVIVDDRLFQKSELEGLPVTPIVINNNLIDLTTTPSKPGRRASVVMRPRVRPWTVTNKVRTVAADGRTDISVSSPSHGRIVLDGQIAARSAPALKVFAFDDPARYARTAFIKALRQAGVRVDANQVVANPARLLPSQRKVTTLPTVARLQSLPLSQEATYVLKVSYNRGAQTMICRLAVAAGSTDCDDGLDEAGRLWTRAGLDTRGAVLIDGSGLLGNLVTADNQVDLQTIMARRPDAAAWRATMPIMGVDGSLAFVQPGGPATGKIFAKTGTLAAQDLFNGRRFNFPTKALGGYMDAKSGRRLAFTIVVSNAVFDTIAGAFAANDDVGNVATVIQQSY